MAIFGLPGGSAHGVRLGQNGFRRHASMPLLIIWQRPGPVKAIEGINYMRWLGEINVQPSESIVAEQLDVAGYQLVCADPPSPGG